ncbi:hypothetical protein [Streptomyces phaeochromogenes]|uniref:hypothetical protein n=1 Tax=Streptomyces phaeochromogenes TaxID=1923 RepID=UPI0037189BB2
MNDNAVALTLGLVGLLGAFGTAVFGVRSAKEAAGGAVNQAALARNAEFQNQRRTAYAAVLEALTDGELGGGVQKRAARALLVVRDAGLKTSLIDLADDSSAVDRVKLGALASAMNDDAGKE